MGHGGKPWVADFRHAHYQAARNAILRVFNIDPDFTREGGSIPVTLTFQELTGKNVLLLPIGSSDDGAHSQNEKINISNYIQGVIIRTKKLNFFLFIYLYLLTKRSNYLALIFKKLQKYKIKRRRIFIYYYLFNKTKKKIQIILFQNNKHKINYFLTIQNLTIKE
jgi:hypothetical protein